MQYNSFIGFNMTHLLALVLALLLAVFAVAQMAAQVTSDWGNHQMRFDMLNKMVCSNRPRYGKCKGHRKMWFYNKIKGRCETFTYSNCGGNRNRFFTREDCDQFCTEKLKTINFQGPFIRS